MKKLAGKLHLYLGLATGIVFSLVCLTGAFVAFTEEMLNVVNRKHLRITPRESDPVPVEKVLETYRAAYPKEQVFVFNAYREKDRTYDFFSAVQKEGSEDDFGGYKMVYADPYSGEILHLDRGTLDLIVLAVTMHVNLLMGDFGHELIRYCTLIFLIQLLAGVALWWPRSRAALKGAVRWAWNSGPRRRLYDSHRTVGFYAASGLLVMVLTALVMSWSFVAKPVMAAFGGEPSLVHEHDEEHVHPPRKEGPEYSYDALVRQTFAREPGVNMVTVALPFPDTVGVLHLKTHAGTTFLNFAVGAPTEYDRVTGEMSTGFEAEGEARNAKIYAWNLLIHMGFWGGTPTKILYFFLGLLVASLPVTGFFMWRGKWKRKKAGLSENDGEIDIEVISAPSSPSVQIRA